MLARDAGVRVVSYAFASTVADAVARNASRTGRARIENVGIYTVAKRLVAPTEDEGFDARFEVRLGDAGFVVTALG